MRPDEGKERRRHAPAWRWCLRPSSRRLPRLVASRPTAEREATMSTAPTVAARPLRPRPDLTVQDYGSIVLLRAGSSAGRHWLDEHVSQTEYPPFPAGTRVCEPRLVLPVIAGARAAGLVVETR